jgi:hypothetical protein
MDPYRIKTTESAESQAIRFNLSTKATKSPTNSEQVFNLNEAFIDPVGQKASLLRLDIPQVGRSTNWKRPEDLHFNDRYAYQNQSVSASIISGSPKSSYRLNTDPDFNTSIFGRKTGYHSHRRDDLDFTSSMHREELNMSIISGNEIGMFDLTSRLRIQKKDPMIEYDSNVIIRFVKENRKKFRAEHHNRNQDAIIIQNWMILLFQKIMRTKTEIRERNHNARVIQKFCRHFLEVGFAARIIQAFLANHKCRKPVERPVYGCGSYCTKRVGNRKTINWAAKLIQNKFRNTRTKPVVPRLKKLILATGVMTKRSINLAGFLKKVVALQTFYRKLKARKLHSARVIQDFVDQDIKKKSKLVRPVQPKAIKKVQLNSRCYITKECKPVEVAPKQKVGGRSVFITKTIRPVSKTFKRPILGERKLLSKKSTSKRVFAVVILLQRAVKRFLNSRKIFILNKPVINDSRQFATKLLASKRAIDDANLIRKFCKTSPRPVMIPEKRKEIVEHKVEPKIYKKPIVARFLLGKRVFSKKIFQVIIVLQKAVKRFLAKLGIRILQIPIISDQNQFATKWLASKKAIYDANLITNFMKVKPRAGVIVKEVVKEVIKEVPVIKEVEVIKKVEVIREVIKEVPVIKEVEVIKKVDVIREVVKEVVKKVEVTKDIVKPICNRLVHMTKEIKKQQPKPILRPRISGPVVNKTSKSNNGLKVIMLLQKVIRQFLYSRMGAISKPIICQTHQRANKKIIPKKIHDYAKRIQRYWRGCRNQHVKVYIEVPVEIIKEVPVEVVIVKEVPVEVLVIKEVPVEVIKERHVEVRPRQKAQPTCIVKKTKSQRYVNYVVYLQRFFRNLRNRIEPKSFPRIRPVGITKAFRLNVVPRRRVVMPMMAKKTKTVFKLAQLLKTQRIIRAFLTTLRRPKALKAKPVIHDICYYTKNKKSYPEEKAAKVQNTIRSFILMRRVKKAIAENKIKRMAIRNSIYQLTKAAKYTKQRLYNIDFILTLERQATKYAQELAFIRLADYTRHNKGLLNEIDDRENYYYRSIKCLKNLAQSTDRNRANRSLINSVQPTFKMVLTKFPQDIRNIYSHKWFTEQRAEDDYDLWTTNVYKSKGDPNFVNMIKYLLKDHVLPTGYIEKRIKKTHIENLTIFAQLQMTEMFLYDYYNEIVCKTCFCKKEECDECDCRCHDKYRVKMIVSNKKIVLEEEVDPLDKITVLKSKPNYDAAYDQLNQKKEVEDVKQETKQVKKKAVLVAPKTSTPQTTQMKTSKVSLGEIDLEDEDVDIARFGYILDENV